MRFTLLVVASADVLINEIADKGSEGSCDGNDWVELLNNGDAAVSMDGWQLYDSDGPLSTKAFTFPSTATIAAGEYKTYCTKKPDSPQFGIGGDDSVSLVSVDGSTNQTVTLEGKGSLGVSFARKPDGTFTYTLESTFGAENVIKDLEQTLDCDQCPCDADNVAELDPLEESGPCRYPFTDHTDGSMRSYNFAMDTTSMVGENKVSCNLTINYRYTNYEKTIMNAHCWQTMTGMMVSIPDDEQGKLVGPEDPNPMEVLHFLHNDDAMQSRARLSYAIMRDLGFVAPCTVPTHLFINGDYSGIGDLVENVDETFINKRFVPEEENADDDADDDDDDDEEEDEEIGFWALYKDTWPQSDVLDSYRDGLVKVSNETKEDDAHTVFVELFKAAEECPVSTCTKEEAAQILEEHTEVNSFVNGIVGMMLMGQWETLKQGTSYMYVTDGKLFYIPSSFENALGGDVKDVLPHPWFQQDKFEDSWVWNGHVGRIMSLAWKDLVFTHFIQVTANGVVDTLAKNHIDHWEKQVKAGLECVNATPTALETLKGKLHTSMNTWETFRQNQEWPVTIAGECARCQQTQPDPSQVVINEVADKGSSDDCHASNGVAHDWIELFNKGDTDVNLKDWLLYDNKGPGDAESLRFGDTTISAGGFITLCARSDDGVEFGIGSGDKITLVDTNGATSSVELPEPSSEAGEGEYDKSWALGENGKFAYTWHTTFGEKNVMNSTKPADWVPAPTAPPTPVDDDDGEDDDDDDVDDDDDTNDVDDDDVDDDDVTDSDDNDDDDDDDDDINGTASGATVLRADLAMLVSTALIAVGACQ